MPDGTLLHATCVAIGDDGVLILGPPGSGKSDLALRLIDQSGLGLKGKLRAAELVADDQVAIYRDRDTLIASAPPALSGKIEIRGMGIAILDVRASVPLVLAVRLAEAATIERLPDLGATGFEVLGIRLPLALIDASKPSAPARLRAAMDWFASR